MEEHSWPSTRGPSNGGHLQPASCMDFQCGTFIEECSFVVASMYSNYCSIWAQQRMLYSEALSNPDNNGGFDE